MITKRFAYKVEWVDRAAKLGYDMTFWGYGSRDAYSEGNLVGVYVDEFDCNNGEICCGWLMVDEE